VTTVDPSVIEILAIEKHAPFDFRWPEGTKSFETGWSFALRANGRRHTARHGLGAREVYGRLRVHTVTRIDGEVQVEGVEADDYPASRALISRLRRPGRATARTWEEVPTGYEGFEIVDHRREIDAPYSPQCLAVKIREDDLDSWALHAWLRSQLPRKTSAPTPSPRTGGAVHSSAKLPPPPSPDAQAVARALLAHGDTLASQLKDGEITQFTPNQQANQLIHDDPFAFLLAVISESGMPPISQDRHVIGSAFEPLSKLPPSEPVTLTDDEIQSLFDVLWYVQRVAAMHKSLRSSLRPRRITRSQALLLDSLGAALDIWHAYVSLELVDTTGARIPITKSGAALHHLVGEYDRLHAP